MNLVLSGVIAVCLLVGAGGEMASAHGSDLSRQSSGAASSSNYAPLPRAVRHEVSSVPPATLDAVGTGKRHGGRNQPPGRVKAAKLSRHGKPEMAYIIGEFCPYCAGESWSVAVALSRFGRFDGLSTLASSADDDPPSIQTISFRYSHFHSRYVAYDPIVNEDANRKRVERVPAKIRRVWTRYGPPGYPFVDFGGRAVLNVPSFDPRLLANLTRKQIASDLRHPKRPVAKAIDGSANQLTAAICIMTKNKPGRVCATKTISTIRRSLRPLHASPQSNAN